MYYFGFDAYGNAITGNTSLEDYFALKPLYASSAKDTKNMQMTDNKSFNSIIKVLMTYKRHKIV